MEPKVSIISMANMMNSAGAAAALKRSEATKTPEADAQQSTYQTVESKGNAWNAFICALGRGYYSWSKDVCDYRNGTANWRR
jgi:hypothetical protein